jgi:hypothetical protein
VKKIIAAVAAVVVGVTLMAPAVNASVPAGKRERKLVQTVMKSWWRDETPDTWDTICRLWRGGDEDFVTEEFVDITLNAASDSGIYVSSYDARYVIVRFFDSACY